MELAEKQKIAQMCREYRVRNLPMITQYKLADECGLIQTGISYIETERWGKISVAKITQLKEYLEKMQESEHENKDNVV